MYNLTKQSKLSFYEDKSKKNPLVLIYCKTIKIKKIYIYISIHPYSTLPMNIATQFSNLDFLKNQTSYKKISFNFFQFILQKKKKKSHRVYFHTSFTRSRISASQPLSSIDEITNRIRIDSHQIKKGGKIPRDPMMMKLRHGSQKLERENLVRNLACLQYVFELPFAYVQAVGKQASI